MLAQLEMFINLRLTRAAETDKENRSVEYENIIEIPRFYYSIKFILAGRVYLNNRSSLLLDNLELHDTIFTFVARIDSILRVLLCAIIFINNILKSARINYKLFSSVLSR